MPQAAYGSRKSHPHVHVLSAELENSSSGEYDNSSKSGGQRGICVSLILTQSECLIIHK